MAPKPPQDWRIYFKRSDVESFRRSVLHNLEYRLAKDQYSATRYDYFLAVAYAVAERLIERWIATQQAYHRENPKRVYYLSMEYLLGRALANNLINLGLYEVGQQALAELGLDLGEVCEAEVDAGLGHGGLGRLAACFLDSLATLGIPAHGYGIRYEYGVFHQKIVGGRQVEAPDNWLALPNPWEIPRPECTFKVRFGGRVERVAGAKAYEASRWVEGEEVLALPYDLPIAGYATQTVNTLRLWSARSSEEFNLEYFNSGDYVAACEKKILSEKITKVLYPNDNFSRGKELRLQQEYFLVSASLQDIIRRFKEGRNDWSAFPDLVAIQLNDTHPTLAIPELMRLLVDEEGLDWDTAWDLAVRTFAYTNHTVMAEALEEWPVSLLEHLLPRHLEIIYLINHFFLEKVARRYPGDVDRLRRMSLIGEDGVKRVRMAHLAVVGSHAVNGVSALHSRILQESVFRDFHEFWPGKFTNKTNGITPRRWLRQANPALSALITEAIGEGWLKDLTELRRLEAWADDPGFREEWRRVKQSCKDAVVDLVQRETGVPISPDLLFDVQVKRIHEYKRQLLFALYIIASYLWLKDHPGTSAVPRACLIGGKAPPEYHTCKLIIRLINAIADVVNRDPEVNRHLRVAFLPNYRVTLAEKIIPGADLSEQISTAGMEASGTGNMKFALNGAVIIGTLDGANVEILEEVGPENIFIFGHTAEQIRALRERGYDPGAYIAASPELQRVLHLLESDFFCPEEPGLFRPLYEELTRRDHYFLMADFDLYRACQERVARAWQDREGWTRRSILNVARCGKFSSDRAVAEYAREIWRARPVRIPAEEVYPKTFSCRN
ncbi:MAG: glycogen/starch/alpha-glucan phosphorylase [Bacillota bacterium]|nr:glycogen/starch/alpha-glucan phosphorylase [Bacillota bacterium]